MEAFWSPARISEIF
uniref:Uncharacterized protein n=1 Tax=Anguilla anguilla TaxID=7936 RepID=A0A0E9VZX4_ANGAN